jgi:hypothetical protein
MEYSSLVKERADNLILSFLRHLSDCSLSELKAYYTDKSVSEEGEFLFDLSDLSRKEQHQVLSLASETLKFNYLFKVSKSGTDKVRYIKTISGSHPKVLNTALFLIGLSAWVVIAIGFIILLKRVFGV